jgi:hypothetical protein
MLSLWKKTLSCSTSNFQPSKYFLPASLKIFNEPQLTRLERGPFYTKVFTSPEGLPNNVTIQYTHRRAAMSMLLLWRWTL